MYQPKKRATYSRSRTDSNGFSRPEPVEYASVKSFTGGGTSDRDPMKNAAILRSIAEERAAIELEEKRRASEALAARDFRPSYMRQQAQPAIPLAPGRPSAFTPSQAAVAPSDAAAQPARTASPRRYANPEQKLPGSPYIGTENSLGRYGKGNIDLFNRPQFRNPDGSVSTVRSISIGTDDGEVLIPTVGRDANGRPRIMSDDEAIDEYFRTGNNLGTFKTIEEADAYADRLHKQQEAYYTGKGQNLPSLEQLANPMRYAETRRQTAGGNNTVSTSTGEAEILQGEPANLTREGQWAAKHPVLGTAMYGVTNLVGVGEGAVNKARELHSLLTTGEKLDSNSYKTPAIAQGYRTGAAEGFRRGLESGPLKGVAEAAGIKSDDGVYSQGERTMDFLSGVVADMASSQIGMLAGGPMSYIGMGFNAANQKAYELSQDDSTSAAQAAALSTLNGVWEAFFERFSIENWDAMRVKSPTNVSEFLQNMAKSFAVEASEEGGTETANILTDLAIRLGNSETGREYQSYIDAGIDPATAAGKTLKSALGQIGMSMLAGGLSGAMSSGAALGANTLFGGRTLQNATMRGQLDLRDAAQAIDTSTPQGQRAMEMALDIATREEAGERPRAVDYGFLNNAIQEANEAGAFDSYNRAVERQASGRETALEKLERVRRTLRGEDLAPATTVQEERVMDVVLPAEIRTEAAHDMLSTRGVDRVSWDTAAGSVMLTREADGSYTFENERGEMVTLDSDQAADIIPANQTISVDRGAAVDMASTSAETAQTDTQIGPAAVEQVTAAPTGEEVQRQAQTAPAASPVSDVGQQSAPTENILMNLAAERAQTDAATLAQQRNDVYQAGYQQNPNFQSVMDRATMLTEEEKTALFRQGGQDAVNAVRMEAQNGGQEGTGLSGQGSNGDLSQRTGEQTGRVSALTEAVRRIWRTRKAPADAGSATLRISRRAKAQEVIPGTRRGSSVFVPANKTELMQKGEAEAKSFGLKVVSWAGGEAVSEKGGHFRGCTIPGTDSLYAQADNPDFSQDRIIRHEIAENKLSRPEFESIIEEARSVSTAVEDAIKVYQAFSTDEENEYGAAKELVCDSNGLMNQFERLARENPDNERFKLYRDILQEAIETINPIVSSRLEGKRVQAVQTAQATESTVKPSQAMGAVQQAAEENNSRMAEFSVAQMAEAMDMEVRVNEDGVPYEIVDPKTGKAVTNVTPQMINNTPFGTLINASLVNGTIDAKTAKFQKKFFADLMNLFIKNPDVQATWETFGTELFSAIKNNSDKQYGTTIDFGTICAKTQGIINVMSDAMVRIGKGLTRQQIIQVYNATNKAGLSVPCPVCYVFSRWMGVPSLLETMRKCQETYGRMSEGEVQQYVRDLEAKYGGKDGINKKKTSLQNKIRSREKSLQRAKERFTAKRFNSQEAREKAFKNLTKTSERILREADELQKELDEIVSYNWVTQVLCQIDSKRSPLRNENGDVMLDPAYKEVPPEVLLDLRRTGEFADPRNGFSKSWTFRNTRGAGMGKAILPYSGASIGDIIRGSAIRWGAEQNPFLMKNSKEAEKVIENAIVRMRAQNLIGGQRLQSTSDFRAEWALDYLMSFMEMQAIGAKGQMYTKVIEAVDMLASSGCEVNMSIMGQGDGYHVDENGKLVLDFSTVTGINFDQALRMTRKYDNAQMILVGLNDTHIKLALADDRIGFIIPWHSSGNSEGTLKALMGAVNEELGNGTDYTDAQSDQIIDNSDEKKALRQLRLDIIKGNLWEEFDRKNPKNNKRKELTLEQRIMLRDNAFLRDLYHRFYMEKGSDEYGTFLNADQAGQIFPYEYWDKSLTIKDAKQNGLLFQEYCASLGIKPRFSGVNVKGKVIGDFTKEDGYWKLLIDRRMYNRDGTYHVVKAVSVNDIKIDSIPMAVNSNLYNDDSRTLAAVEDSLKAISNEPNDLSADGTMREQQDSTALGEVQYSSSLMSENEQTASDTDSDYAPTFYSKLQREVQNYKGEKLGAASVESYLKGKGVKDEEIKWSGIRTFLEGKKSVSKQELMEYLKANEFVVEEKLLTGALPYADDDGNEYHNMQEMEAAAKKLAEEQGLDPSKVVVDLDDDDTLYAEIDGERIIEAYYPDPYTLMDAGIDDMGNRWSQYKLKGGDNYREILFKVPGIDYSNDAMRTHWDDVGVLAHARVQDFDTADGGKALFVEEIQSDWHNAGQKEGYKDIQNIYEEDRAVKRANNAYTEVAKVLEKAGYTEDPVDVYYRYVSMEEDAWNKAKTGIDNNVASIITKARPIWRAAMEARNNRILKNGTVPDAPYRTTYTDYVLKNLLRMAAEGGYDYLAWTTGKMQEDRWSDEYAEGYRIEYDQEIPKFLRKYGKQWGAGLQNVKIYGGWDRAGNAPYVPAIVVNDAMKQSVLYEGQPMFSRSLTAGLSHEEIESRLDKLIKKYGALPKGEKPKKDVSVPAQISDNKRVRRFARTILESGITTDQLDDRIKEAILKDSLAYEPVTDKDAAEYAASVIRVGGVESAQKEWDRARRSDSFNKDSMALGQFLLKEYAKANDIENAMSMIEELAAEGTRMGQNIQAMRMLKKYAEKVPAIGLSYIQRTVDQMNRENKRKMGKKYKEMAIDQNLAAEYMNAKTRDEIDASVAKIYKNLGSQVQMTTGERLLDRLRTWRYMSMLGNPRTHVRNLVGNAIFVPTVALKNVIGAGLESAVNAEERTKTLSVTAEARQFAKRDALEMRDALSGEGDKTVRQRIMDERIVFPIEILNKMSKGNSAALEYEDWVFLRTHYQNSLAQYLSANHINTEKITPEQLAKARKYAVSEAQKATYRDANKVSAWLNQSGKAGAVVNYMMEGLLPFKKTPMNILSRGIEYSPAGLVRTLAKGTYDLNKGKMSVNEYIDRLSAGLSGTAIFGLGMFLASVGAILGGYDDDDDKTIRKLKGEQEYAVKIGNKTYTIDWAAPGSLPLFVGVETMNALNRERGTTFADISKAAMRLIDPMINMSMLSGLNDTLDAISYSDNKLSAATMEVFYNLLGQYIPTLAGQVARTVDTTQRINYQDMNTGMSKNMLYFFEKMQNKIPYMTFSNEPYLNEFGQENVSASRFAAFVQNFLSPGYFSEIKDDKVLKRLEALQGQQEERVFPKKMPKYFGTKDERVDLTAAQYTKFQRTAGQLAYNILDRMVDDRRYNSLTPEQQAEAVKMAYDYAKAVGRKSVQPEYDLTGKPKKVYGEVEEGSQAYDAILSIVQADIITKGVEADYDDEGNAITNTKKWNTIDAILDSDLDDDEMGDVFSRTFPSEKLENWEADGGDPYDFMMGAKIDQDISQLSEEQQKKKYSYVVGNTEYSEEQKVAWFKNSGSADSKSYTAWSEAGGVDWDYLKHRSNLEKFDGLETKDKRAKVIAYIKSQTNNEAKRKALWQMAGYQLDSKKNKQTVKNGNYNKYFR